MGNNETHSMGRFWNQLNLAHRFNLTSFVVVVLAALMLGWWVSRSIHETTVQRSASTLSLLVYAFMENPLQELGQQTQLSPSTLAVFSRLLNNTELGQQVVRFKVWGKQGLVLFSTEASQIGKQFPIEDDMALPWQKGVMSAGISTLSEAENRGAPLPFKELLEVYIPVRQEATNKVLAVVEFYGRLDGLDQELALAQRKSWVVVGATMLAAYLLLIGIVKRGSDTIVKQGATLQQQVQEQNTLMLQNTELTDRVRRAATRTTAINERFLRRVSAELHDGPAQDLSHARLRLDALRFGQDTQKQHGTILAIEASLERAITEIRSIAGGLRLPELEALGLRACVQRATHDHMRRTGCQARLNISNNFPDDVPMPVKITVYRLVQEGLSNAHRHAHDHSPSVQVQGACPYSFTVEIQDNGPGFLWQEATKSEQHLGLLGLRERVESIGGTFVVKSLQKGTSLEARIPYQPIGGQDLAQP